MANPRLIVTPESVWLQRRQLLKLAGISAASGVGLGAGAVWAQTRSPQVQPVVPMASTPSQVRGARATDKVTPWKDATTYNNFYEFGTDKSDPYNEAHRLITSPWQVRVEGLVNKPTTFDIDDLRRLAPIEERIYRLR